MFVTIRGKAILASVLIMVTGLILSFVIVKAYKSHASSDNILNYTIVLDAGHGGIDGGSVGVETGVNESELNLKIVKKLQKQLEGFGFRVVLTRTDKNGLYSESAQNKKLDDMKKRKKIIEDSKANLVLSVHMNSFPTKSEKGAQVFYIKEDTKSKTLADTLQQQLLKNVPNARKNSNFGDLFILRCTENPAVLIECGFLSNPEEEALLVTDKHQQLLAYNIFCGVVKYFEVINDKTV